MHDSLEHALNITCSVCGLFIHPDRIFTCENCHAMVYCSPICRQLDWDHVTNGDHSHRHWCYKMKCFMATEPRVFDLPLSFAAVTTSPSFTKHDLAQFLRAHNLLGNGLWKYECHFNLSGIAWDSISAPGAELHLFDALWIKTRLDPDSLPQTHSPAKQPSAHIPYEDAMLRAYVLPTDAIMLSLSPGISSSPPATALTSILHHSASSVVSVQLADWADYYNWRGLSVMNGNCTSPMAILMHWPLTIYFILGSLLPKTGAPTIRAVWSKRVLVIHVIGVEHELSLLPVFKELDYLVKPELYIRLFFIGTHIDPSVNRHVFHLSERLSVTVWCGVYDTFICSRQSAQDAPDLIIGFNSGLAAYATWVPTLRTIATLRVPTYFTDACLYSCAWGYRVVDRLGLGVDQYRPDCCPVLDDGDGTGQTAPVLNPFRSPIRMRSAGVRWGWFRNAFIFTPFETRSSQDAFAASQDLPDKFASLQM